jgi:hypothetical protein
VRPNLRTLTYLHIGVDNRERPYPDSIANSGVPIYQGSGVDQIIVHIALP